MVTTSYEIRQIIILWIWLKILKKGKQKNIFSTNFNGKK